MKRIWLLLILMVCTLCSWGTPADNSLWTMHLSYQVASKTLGVGSTTYVLFEGNLLAYDAQDQSVRTFDRLTGLSDKGISYMGWSDTQKCLVLLYQNRNIDLLYENGEVVNIPQIKNYTEHTLTLTNLSVNGDWVVISATDGVVVLNLKRAEVKGYYRLGQLVKDAAVIENTVFASLSSVCVQGRLTDNLYDGSQWKTAFDFSVEDIVPAGGGAYLAVPHVAGKTESYSGISYVKLQSDGSLAIRQVSPVLVSRGWNSNGRFMFAGSGHFIAVTADEPFKEAHRVALASQPVSASYASDGTYWLVYSNGKIVGNKISENGQFAETDGKIGGFGPLHDLCYKLQYVGERLLVAGGRFDNAGKQFAPTAMAYENGEWKAFQYDGFELNDHALYRNVMSIAQDPSDASHHYVSCSSGLLEFRDFNFVRHLNASNSPIEPANGASSQHENYTMVDALTYDAEGNLWMTNYETKNNVKMIKPDDTWVLPYIPEFTGVPTPEKMLIDRDGVIWVTSRRTTSLGASGLLAFDYAQNPDDIANALAQFRSSATNGDGKSCNLESMNDICQDLNGQIWLGCGSGVYAITKPSEWFSSSFIIYQPKVPRNDGTNYADYLLTNVPVTAIAVDGGNRKWLGTQESGIYLVSPDGTEVIAHYTYENSPLLSNNIFSLAVNPATGELMIGTDVGLCSLQTGITPPVNTLSKSNIKVYPNPVRPDYMGNVTITGLTDGAEVKVVSTCSQLVDRGNAVGGTFIWDVRNSASGRRVAPGVYYLLIATANGSDSVAAKVVVI